MAVSSKKNRESKDIVCDSQPGELMSRDEKRSMLAKMARDENLSISERQKAIDIDNKMEDEYVTKILASQKVLRLEELL